jgi:hypothetical protein
MLPAARLAPHLSVGVRKETAHGGILVRWCGNAAASTVADNVLAELYAEANWFPLGRAERADRSSAGSNPPADRGMLACRRDRDRLYRNGEERVTGNDYGIFILTVQAENGLFVV